MRKYLLVLFALIFTNIAFANPLVQNLKTEGFADYQPIFVNDQVMWNPYGNRVESFEIRYEPIKEFCKQYSRKFSVLDIGACNGCFSLQLMHDFDCSAVMIDSGARLKDICTLNTNKDKLIYLQKTFTAGDIEHLANNEHFDVVIALFVLHHVDDYNRWINALTRLADNVILDIPNLDDPINTWEKTRSMARDLLSRPNWVQIGSTPRGNSNSIMLWHCSDRSSFTSYKKNLGIKPSTFFRLGGVYPHKSYVDDLNRIIPKNVKWRLLGKEYEIE
jgi:SAM-dependent methyltransferase